MAIERRLLHAALRLNVPLLRVQLQHRLGWSFCYFTCWRWFIFCSLHRFHEEFLFASCFARCWHQARGFRSPWAWKFERENSVSATGYCQHELQLFTFWIHGRHGFVGFFFLRTDWCPRSLEGQPTTESEKRSCWFCWSPTFECTRPKNERCKN